MSKMFSKLEQTIKKNAQAYYTNGSQEMTDKEFDSAVEKLKKENPNSELLKTGWGYDVNLDSTPGEKIKHKYGQAGSLDKVHNWKELKYSLKYNEIYMSLKLDGLSVVVYFENGHIVRALTRGDGTIGIDITEKVLTILGFDSIDDKNFTGAVRGEILMSLDKFEEFNEIHPEAKNPRNSTAGIINSNEVTEDIKFLEILFYTVIGDEGFNDSNLNMLSMTYVVSFLNRYFGSNHVAPYNYGTLIEANIDEIMYKLKEEWYGKYPADGIVLTHNKLEFDETTKYISYDAQAFKFPAESKKVKVTDVLWGLSKTGYMIPRIQVEPVQLSGTTVTYATGFNAQYIQDTKIGKGAIVDITKSGEIIPYIKEVIKSAEPKLPETCPMCNSTLCWNGVHLQCENDKCDNMRMQDLLIWSNMLAPKDGLGDILREKFYLECYGQDVSIDQVMFYQMNKSLEGKQFELFSETVYTLINGTFSVDQALKALNIPRLSDKTAEKLSKHVKLIEDIFKWSMNHTDKETYDRYKCPLSDAIGDANSESILHHLHKFTRLNFIWDRVEKDTPNSVEFKGKVAITGKLSCKRADFEKELKSAGYEVGDISKDTKFLITDDPTSSSSKNIKATKLGIVKINEGDFRNKYM